MGTETQTIDKSQLRRSFQRAAADYDHHARLQQEVGERLLERVAEIRLTPASVLDVGMGTGRCTEVLARRFRNARVAGIDIAPAMARLARGRRRLRLYPAPRYLVADMEALPLAASSVDLLFSNLSFQWASDLDILLAELYRVARPGTPLLFSSFGPDTLRELRGAWAAVDPGVHVNRFLDMHDVADAMMKAGFTDVVTDVDRLVEHHPDVMSVMRGLKAIGAHNVDARRRRALTGRRRLEGVLTAYEAHRSDAGLPVTYEVVYGLGWVVEPTPVMVPMTAFSPPRSRV
ncbi:MAG: malonyl-ACP O-methyltransferase BioC [Gammaproteobacteria bacterium]|nr:malonyl-ACP O-methyltransferase BioC [Gammaproteobacteria bacterium]